jgi:Xaa-Pro aminopeptidase
MNVRLSRLRMLLKGLGVDALLVTDDTNVSYLSSYASHDAWLFITQKHAYYVTDFRYTQEASAALTGGDLSVVQFKDSIFRSIVMLAERSKVGRIGVDENRLNLGQYQRFKTLCSKKIKLKLLQSPVECLRMVKDADELSITRQAIKINLDAFSWIGARIKPGLSEKDILVLLEGFVRRRQVGFSFDPIIASGPNTALPHAKVTERKLLMGEPLLLDLGIEKDSYKSDLTRMFFLGKMTPSFSKALSIIKDAQWEAIRLMKPGVLAKDVDAAARKYLKKYGWDKYFGHSLGHGVGLDIHEMPRLSAKSGAILVENMVVTVEPGVYFPKKYGVRLEEMVLVTHKACEVLSGDSDHRSE